MVSAMPVLCGGPMVSAMPVLCGGPMVSAMPVLCGGPMVSAMPVLCGGPMVSAMPVLCGGPMVSAMPVLCGCRRGSSGSGVTSARTCPALFSSSRTSGADCRTKWTPPCSGPTTTSISSGEKSQCDISGHTHPYTGSVTNCHSIGRL